LPYVNFHIINKEILKITTKIVFGKNKRIKNYSELSW